MNVMVNQCKAVEKAIDKKSINQSTSYYQITFFAYIIHVAFHSYHFTQTLRTENRGDKKI